MEFGDGHGDRYPIQELLEAMAFKSDREVGSFQELFNTVWRFVQGHLDPLS
jgi:hypothetical protein